MLIGSSLDGQFTVVKQLGEGSYSTVYQGRHQSTLKPVAIKILDSDISNSDCAREQTALATCSPVPGVPQVLATGSVGSCSYLVMELLGPDVYALMKTMGKLSVRTVILTALQTLRTVKGIHEQGYLHLDIKPDNVLLKRKKTACQCYLVDFGLALKYACSGGHYSYHEQGEFRGNAVFASRHMLRRCAPGRRDDLESLIYTWAFMANGTLPWVREDRQSLLGNRAALSKVKSNTAPSLVCGILPAQFAEMLADVGGLAFAERPNYAYYTNLLIAAAASLNLSLTDLSPWEEVFSTLLSTKPSLYLSEKLMHRGNSIKSQKPSQITAQHRRSTKKRLTKNMDTLGFVRSSKRHFAMIEKSKSIEPGDLETKEMTFTGRRVEREGTEKREVVATPVLRSKLREMKFGEAAEWAVSQ